MNDIVAIHNKCRERDSRTAGDNGATHSAYRTGKWIQEANGDDPELDTDRDDTGGWSARGEIPRIFQVRVRAGAADVHVAHPYM